MITIKKYWITGLIFVLTSMVGGFASAQSSYALTKADEIKVSGTSTIHDWEMSSEEASGRAMIELDGRAIKSISSLNFSFKAESLKSGKRQMDRNAYNALETGSHPEIKFTLREVTNVTSDKITATGDLTISGKTNRVRLTVNYSVSGRNVSFSGSHDITFSEFGIDPPTAMLGTVRTGDELELTFNVTYSL